MIASSYRAPPRTEKKDTIVMNRARDPNASGAKRRASNNVPTTFTTCANPFPVISVRTWEINFPEVRGNWELLFTLAELFLSAVAVLDTLGNPPKVKVLAPRGGLI
jgi:hypothetical protein